MSNRLPLVQCQVSRNGILGIGPKSNKYSSTATRRSCSVINCIPQQLDVCKSNNTARHGHFAARTSSRIGGASGLLPSTKLSISSKFAATNPRLGAELEHNLHTNSSHNKRTYPSGVIITGGTSGIGYAVAKQAILEGVSHVRIVTRNPQRGQAAIEKLRQETSTDANLDHIEAETAQYGDAKLFQPTATNIPLTTIIHCAGISQTSLLTSTSTDSIQKILSVNLESSALLSKSLLKRYMQTCASQSRQKLNPKSESESESPPPEPRPSNPSWQIINISSLLATKGGHGTSIYAASKAGMIALTRAVTLEAAEVTRRYHGVAPGFRANVVVPGYIDTPMTGSFSGQTKDKLTREIPAGRFGTPAEVADAVMFLLTNEYANNCVLNLDGGLSAT